MCQALRDGLIGNEKCALTRAVVGWERVDDEQCGCGVIALSFTCKEELSAV